MHNERQIGPSPETQMPSTRADTPFFPDASAGKAGLKAFIDLPKRLSPRERELFEELRRLGV